MRPLRRSYDHVAPGALREAECRIGADDERGRVVLGEQLGDPAGERDDADLGKRSIPERGLEALEQPLRISAVRLREQHAEAPAADTAGEIAGAADVAQHLGDLREDAVSREMADAGVDRRQAVDVEHEQGELLATSSRAPDLAVEQRMECRPVVEVGERIALGDGIGLAKLERRLECRARNAEDVLERGDVHLAEAAIWSAGEHCEHARLGRRVEERDCEAAPDRVAVLRGVVAVERDLDRARSAVVGNSQSADLGDLRLREPDRREDRLAVRPTIATAASAAVCSRASSSTRTTFEWSGVSIAVDVESCGAPEIAAVMRAGSVRLSASFNVCANSASRLS